MKKCNSNPNNKTNVRIQEALTFVYIKVIIGTRSVNRILISYDFFFISLKPRYTFTKADIPNKISNIGFIGVTSELKYKYPNKINKTTAVKKDAIVYSLLPAIFKSLAFFTHIKARTDKTPILYTGAMKEEATVDKIWQMNLFWF
ncbi:hypothetical protein EEL32_24680 [Brevibacillus laterosporus]|nr:hypothetical protein [Brevibacillus laterosporus]TPG71017.1 hypothetical protein EEL31_23025 [Brevibacillus laterosporus]TPG74775.1 hypothetical protein EEL32_24680 [Brevibacillus laterosporus]